MSSSKSISREIRKILYGSAVAGLAMTGTAHAQDNGKVIEEVVVQGIRASLQQSIEAKRNATGIVDAITAEDVGKFPDKNLAEALQRVPGIVINREFGEGERANLRGTSPTLTRTMLNGHSLATADWFILDQLNTTRSFNYLMLPSDIIGQVAVYKTAQADIEEGGIGGTINVVTRNPFDLEPNATYASLQGAYTELADNFDPQASLTYSWRDSESTFGIIASAIYQERNIRRDGVETLGYFDNDPGAGTQLVPSLIGSALFQQDRIRQGGNIGIQFKPADNLVVNLTGLYSQFQADNINENFLAWGTRAIGNGGTLTNPTIVNDTVVAGTIASLNNGADDFAVVYDAIDRFATATTRNIDLDTRYELNDSWALHFDLGMTDASGNTDAQPFTEFGAAGSFTYDLRGESPQVSFSIDPTDPDDVRLIFSSLHQILNTDKEKYAYADAEKQLDSGVFKSLKFGVKHTDHDRELTFNATTYGAFHVPLNNTPGSAFSSGELTPGDFLENISSTGTLTSYWQVDRNLVEQILFEELGHSGRVFYPQQSFTANEKTMGGFVMGNFAGERWRGNLGVRVIRTEQTTAGAVFAGGPGSVDNPFGRYIPTSVEHDYTDVLPSLNIAYDLRDDLIARFAVAKVMSRPDYTDVVPRTTLNPGALSGQAGNPDLDPYRANQADVSIEWYPDRDSIIALALYYKDIKSFITDRPVAGNFPIQSSTPPNAACTPTGTPNLFDCPFTINTRTNGGGGEVKGAELTITKPLWMGLGVQANYTYSDADTDAGDPLPGNSKNTYNLTAYYENDRVSTRLAFTHRDEFFVTFDRTTPLNQDDLESLDFSFNFKLTDAISLTADAQNLTDEKIKQFAGIQDRPRAIYDNGRVYFVGARMKF
jgi:iron complex outermembrane receptor protein